MMSHAGNRGGRKFRPIKHIKGQALVEYALVLSFISVLCIAVLGGLGESVRGVFLSIMASLAAAGNGF